MLGRLLSTFFYHWGVVDLSIRINNNLRVLYLRTTAGELKRPSQTSTIPAITLSDMEYDVPFVR